MKTHLLQPETHDDVISVLDQIAWSKSSRILLVLPKEQNIIKSKTDLMRLARKAIHQGGQLGLVTSSKELQELATEIGVPVFSSVNVANTKPWRRIRKIGFNKPSPSGERSVEAFRSIREVLKPRDLPIGVRVIAFLSGVIAMLALIGLFTPKATVNLVTTITQQELAMQINGSSSFTTADISGNIPILSEEVIVEGQNQTVTSGEDSVPETYAQCEVEFTSLSNQPVSIPNGTIVLTLVEPVVRYATTRDIIVAGGIDSTAIVPVIALQPGEIGNVAENQIVAMEGNIGVNLRVTNPQACEGGLELLTSVGIESDLEKLRMELKQQLIQTATKELLTQLGDGIEILTFITPEFRVLEEELQPGLGIPSDYLQLKQRASVKLKYIKKMDFETALGLSMDALLENGQKEIPGSLLVTTLRQPTERMEPYSWEVFAVRNVTSVINPELLALNLRGLKLNDALTFIYKLPGVSRASEIKISPKWWQQMPFLSFRINVVTP